MNARKKLFQAMDACHARACAAQRQMLRLIAYVDQEEVWAQEGARDMAHWLWMRYGISDWKARRWIDAAHALESLPVISEAFASGVLGIDRVVELTRLATPETEAELVVWARCVAPGAIRHRAELEARKSVEEARSADRDRTLRYWHLEDGRRMGIAAELPVAEGAVVVRALERRAAEIPEMPDEVGPFHHEARLADALVMLASAQLGVDPDPDRSTVVVHVPVGVLVGGEGGSGIEGGGVIDPPTARRLACSGRLQAVVEDASGNVVRLGRIRRDPPSWMVRQLRYRDGGCRFPGCGTRRFTHAHHITWWERGGATSLENLILLCSFHHKLVHEYGWTVRRGSDGAFRWFRPEGAMYRAGPGPPGQKQLPESVPERAVPAA